MAAVIGAEIQETEIFASLPWRSQDAREYSYFDGRWINPKLVSYDSQAQIELCLNCPFADECKDCVSVKTMRTTKRRRFRLKKGSLSFGTKNKQA